MTNRIENIFVKIFLIVFALIILTSLVCLGYGYIWLFCHYGIQTLIGTIILFTYVFIEDKLFLDMICKNDLDGRYYDYTFIENGMVKLTRPDMENALLVKYEDWCMDYHIIDKWRNIDGTVYS